MSNPRQHDSMKGDGMRLRSDSKPFLKAGISTTDIARFRDKVDVSKYTPPPKNAKVKNKKGTIIRL